MALQIVSNEGLAEDIVQDVFIKIWESRASIDVKNSWFSYLYRSVINACYNEVKRKKVIDLYGSTELELTKISFSQNIEASIDFKQLETLIQHSLEKLPPKCKTIFLLSRFDNYKYKEIATMLNISIKTVEAQMGIAISKLNTDLKPVLKTHFSDIIPIVFFLIILY